MKNPTIIRFKADTSDYDKKVTAAKSKLQQFGLGGKEAGNAIAQLDKVLGTNVATLSKLSLGLGALTGALKVAKDAITSNEVLFDDWQRTIASSKAVYRGFLDALNRGDIGGFLTNINNIVSAARQAYDALDALGTFNAFNQINVAKTKAGLDTAIADYREGKGSKESVSLAAKAYKKELTSRQKFEEKAYKAQISTIAFDRKVDAKMLEKALTGSYGDYASLKALPLSGKKRDTYTTSAGTSISYVTKVAANEREALGAMLRRFNDTELNELQALGAKAFLTSQEIAAVSKQVARVMGKAESTAKTKTKVTAKPETGPTGPLAMTDMAGLTDAEVSMSLSNLKKQLSTWTTTFEQAADASGRAAAQKHIDAIKAEIDLISNESNPFVKLYENASKSITPIQGLTPVADDMESIRENALGAATAFDAASAAVMQFGENSKDAAALAKTFTLAASIAALVGQFATVPKGAEIWSWIAGTIAGTATLVSTVAQLKSLGSFAEGGIVPGRYNGGRDSTYIYASPGELVLNRAQQSNLAAQLNGGGGAVTMEATLSAETIVMAINNWGRRNGHLNIIPQ